MPFEKVHRSGTSMTASGAAQPILALPHTTLRPSDDKIDYYTQHFRLYAVSAQFMEREIRHWAIYRLWEAKFHRGLEALETHPGLGGIVPEYDELSQWLNEQINALTPIPLLYTATFRQLPGQHELPVGMLRAFEVVWQPSPFKVNRSFSSRPPAGLLKSGDRTADGL